MSASHVVWELFGTQAWGTGGNIVAAGILGVPAYLARGPLGRWLAKHIAPHVARHVAAHLTAQPTGFIEVPQELTAAEWADLVARWQAAHQTPAPSAPVAADAPTAPSAGMAPAAVTSPPAPTAAGGQPAPASHHPAPPPAPHLPQKEVN